MATEMKSLTEVWQHFSFAKQDHLKMGAMASGNLLYAAGSSNPVLCDNREGWDGMGGGREVQEGRDMYIPGADSCCSMVETNTTL